MRQSMILLPRLLMVGMLLSMVARSSSVAQAAPATVCTVAPKALGTLFATPGPAPTAPPDLGPGPWSAGTPADPATTAAIEAATRARIACDNANDLLRVLAFFSDDYLRRTIDPTLLARALDLPPTPVPSGQEETLVAVHDVRVLPGGRIRAIVVTTEPTQQPTVQTLFLVYVHVDGAWLIDDLTDLAGAAPTGDQPRAVEGRHRLPTVHAAVLVGDVSRGARPPQLRLFRVDAAARCPRSDAFRGTAVIALAYLLRQVQPAFGRAGGLVRSGGPWRREHV